MADYTTSEDRPEYIKGDMVEVFNPQSNSYLWIEVEEVLQREGSQILVSRSLYFCACWVRTESLATPPQKGIA
jgi:hypothetical protein